MAWGAGRAILGRHVAVLAALHAGGWPIIGAAEADDPTARDLATTELVANELAALAACAPPAALRERVSAAAGAELRLAGGAVVASPGIRLTAGADLGAATGRTVEVRTATPPDRWGRLAAEAIVAVDDESPVWLEARLVGEGRAMVAARPGAGCARALLVREAAARAAGRGLWADPANRPVSADDVAALTARAGGFALVEGRISAVGERHGTVYVNFGRHWREDFTVMVAARDRRAFARAGIDLDRLAGRAVRVRGHIELRGGPAITAVGPEQIEFLEAMR
jgi:hypothetical protein